MLNKKSPFMIVLFGILFFHSPVFANENFEYDDIQNYDDYEGHEEGIIITGYEGDPPADLSIPEQINGTDVIAIGVRAFDDEGLNSVTLPESLLYIFETAFSTNNITEISLPDSLKQIDRRGFFSNDIASVDIPRSLTHISERVFALNEIVELNLHNDITEIDFRAFNNNNLTEINIPPKVTRIEESTFSLNDIEEVIIPNGITYIGDDAFLFNNLEKVILPENVRYIGDSAFRFNNILTLEIPPNAEEIGAEAFRSNDLKEVSVFTSDVEYFSTDVFNYNDLDLVLRSYIGSTTEDLAVDQDIDFEVLEETYEPYTPFEYEEYEEGISITGYDGDPPEELFFPDQIDGMDVLAIGYQAFLNDGLTSITLPENLVYIDNRAFRENDITELTLPNSLEEIDDSAFWQNSIEEVSFTDNLIRIGRTAFEFNNLVNFTIPESVEEIGSSAFMLNDLEDVTVLNPDVEYGNMEVFREGDENLVLRGYTGSTTEDLADDQDITFEPLDGLNIIEEKDTEVSITFSPGGTLSFEAPDLVPFEEISLLPTITEVSTAFASDLLISDGRSSADGWRVDVQAEPLKHNNSDHELSEGSIAIQPPNSISEASGSENELPDINVFSESVIDNGDATTLIQADDKQSNGSFDISFPSDAISLYLDPTDVLLDNEGDRYETTIHWNLISGP